LSAVLQRAHATGLEAWMAAMRERAEAALERVLPSADTHPVKLHQAMRYATLGGGKRVRAMLVYAAGAWAVGRDGGEDAGPKTVAALDAAASAVELVHAYSLVHDDMPCMDDDALRRGRPTVHVAYDEATALLVGDALQTLAFEALAVSPGNDVARQVALLARASGAAGMAGGQAIDLDSVGKPLTWSELEVMHRAKTGALLRASVLLGATASHAPTDAERRALEAYAAAVGLAFQVVDDVLDVETDSATLGKTAGKDAEHDKPTVVTTLGLAQAKALARRLGEDADRALNDLGGDVARLRDIAAFVIGRNH
jgi:farnesyl diphosphate synthase